MGIVCDMKDIEKRHPLDVKDALAQLGPRLAIARKAAAWRQADLAARSGVSRSTLVEIEKGSPHVSMGNYLSVMWALNLLGDLDRIAPMESDSHRMMASRLPQRVRNG